METTQVILEPLEFAYHMDLPYKVAFDSLINPSHLTQEAFDMAESRTKRMVVHALLPCHKVATLSCPADWWSAFKAHWFPAWALRRWPPIVTVVNLYDYYRDVTMPDNGYRRFPLVLCNKEEVS